jgi:adenylate cyclase
VIGTPEISPFEAKLVELLASGIAAGIARLKEEQSAMAARVRFEQFFTPQLAAQLEMDPHLLTGRDAEVTLLFADIRSFSRISGHLGPERTMAWIQDTMGVLSDCVLRCDGVLVDYLGDELMAMWGAPVPQAHHANLACQAAKQMLLALPSLTARWQEELGRAVELGIGINSGIARVGNTGSAHKFKYGPLGDTVNIASRVQGATKYLGADCLFSGNTRDAFQDPLSTRRLARVRVVNIDRPIELYELNANPTNDWKQRCQRYEQTLTALEEEKLTAAREQVADLRTCYPDDGAVVALEKRIDEAFQQGDTRTTAIWHLPGK